MLASESATCERRNSDASVLSTSTASSATGLRNSNRIIEHVNCLLAENPEVKHLLPITITGEDEHVFYNAFKDGVLLSELILKFAPSSLSKDKIHRDFSNSTRKYFLMLENQTFALEAARKLGCKLVNVGAADLADGRSYLILSVIWQVIKSGMIGKVMQATAKTEGTSEESATNDDTLSIADSSIELESAIINLIKKNIANLPEELSSLSSLLGDNALMCTLLNECGAPAEFVETLKALEDSSERAMTIVKIGKQVLGSHCLLEAKDILGSNVEMLSIFFASILERILERRKAEEQSKEAPIVELIEATETQTVTEVKIEEIVDTEVPAAITPDLIEQYKEEVARLQEENDILGDKIVKLQVEIQVSKGHKDEEDDGIAAVDGPKTPLNDDILNQRRNSAKQFKLDRNAQRLRQIYQNTVNMEPLCQAIYSDISLAAMQNGAIRTGVLRKKERHSMTWKPRLMVLRDNFIFCYKEKASPKDKPIDIFRVDDSLIRVMFEVQHMDDPVISVEITSLVNPIYIYLSAPAIILNEWKTDINRAANWWSTEEL